MRHKIATFIGIPAHTPLQSCYLPKKKLMCVCKAAYCQSNIAECSANGTRGVTGAHPGYWIRDAPQMKLCESKIAKSSQLSINFSPAEQLLPRIVAKRLRTLQYATRTTGVRNTLHAFIITHALRQDADEVEANLIFLIWIFQGLLCHSCIARHSGTLRGSTAAWFLSGNPNVYLWKKKWGLALIALEKSADIKNKIRPGFLLPWEEHISEMLFSINKI